MSIDKPPAGTRGTRTPPRLLGKIVMPLMTRIHRLSKDRFAGMELPAAEVERYLASVPFAKRVPTVGTAPLIAVPEHQREAERLRALLP